MTSKVLCKKREFRGGHCERRRSTTQRSICMTRSSTKGLAGMSASAGISVTDHDWSVGKANVDHAWLWPFQGQRRCNPNAKPKSSNQLRLAKESSFSRPRACGRRPRRLARLHKGRQCSLGMAARGRRKKPTRVLRHDGRSAKASVSTTLDHFT
eukprot:CAMPEP_0197454704 /NCGR_PEP_ID=MMETSP1175-20131217/38677_1 /TAXON_ID=1003142 /ORGANISM="Triceratium dubium, Strain CCMP147" /LENGTH=153 /DNA_ID=CAMNT_0042988361 /DNA_START=443 /DNA_END=901 /DNA_ORIENTATION=-